MEYKFRVRFKVGDAVAHVDNLGNRMYVGNILISSVDVSTGNIIELDGKRVFEKKPKKMLRGIECHWYEKRDDGDVVLRKHIFHSRELVPYDVAEKGIEAVIEYQKL